MSEENDKQSKWEEMDSFGAWITITVLVVFFWGTPDLHDRVVGNCILTTPNVNE